MRAVCRVAVVLALGCDGPPQTVSAEVYEMSVAADELGTLSGLCGERGRLFAVGQGAGATGVLYEERSTGLVAAELPEPVPPLAGCVQTADGSVVAVGGAVLVERTPEGEVAVSSVADPASPEASVELLAITRAGDRLLAAGSVDGLGALFSRDEGAWSRVDLGDIAVAPLRSVTVDEDGRVIAVGEPAAAVAVGEGGAVRLSTLSDPLRAVVAGPAEVIAVGRDGSISLVLRNQLRGFASVNVRFLSAAFSDAGDLWLGGQDGAVVRHARLPSGALSTTPRLIDTPSMLDVSALWGSRDRLYAAAEGQLWVLDQEQP